MPTGTSWTLFKALMRQAAEVRGALHIRMPVGQSGWQGRPVAFFDRLEGPQPGLSGIIQCSCPFKLVGLIRGCVYADFDKRVLSRVLPEALKVRPLKVRRWSLPDAPHCKPLREPCRRSGSV